jgi:hypothetical protein
MATKNTRNTKIEQDRGGKDETGERRKSGNDAEVPSLKLTP